jgi:hypothetical protein
MTTIRREMPDPQLDKTEFKRRYRARFYDPAFAPMQAEIERLAEIAWDAYEKFTQGATHAAGRRRFCGSRLSTLHRMA